VPPLHLPVPAWFDRGYPTILSLVSELPSEGLTGEFCPCHSNWVRVLNRDLELMLLRGTLGFH